MKPRVTVIAVALILGVSLWWASSHKPVSLGESVAARAASDGDGGEPSRARTAVAIGQVETAEPEEPNEETVPPGPVPAPSRPIAVGSLEEPIYPHIDAATRPEGELPPVTALENLRTGLRRYASKFGGNPVGENAEIAAALQGANRGHNVFLSDDDGGRLNGSGQLVDAWNTPYFFHQISRTETEIRSAGPDRRLWTADDLVIK